MSSIMQMSHFCLRILKNLELICTDFMLRIVFQLITEEGLQQGPLCQHYLTILNIKIRNKRRNFLSPNIVHIQTICPNNVALENSPRMILVSKTHSLFFNPLSANPIKWSNTLKQLGKADELFECVGPFCKVGA